MDNSILYYIQVIRNTYTSQAKLIFIFNVRLVLNIYLYNLEIYSIFITSKIRNELE